ncbi:MAG TPA: hypothetical protein VGZ47_13585 [Gemmataceae bacterium]|jgi:hypothetical protein|nr:hypothetical protein [Gemmataceae bacterium]
MFFQLKKDWLGNKAGTVIDLPEPGDADLLIKGGVAEALHHDPLALLLAKSIGTMVEGIAVRYPLLALRANGKGAVERIFGPGENGNPDRCFSDWCLQVAILVCSAPSRFFE